MTWWPFKRKPAKPDPLARLAELVEQTRNSFEVEQFRRRRAAAMKGLALKREREEARG